MTTFPWALFPGRPLIWLARRLIASGRAATALNATRVALGKLEEKARRQPEDPTARRAVAEALILKGRALRLMRRDGDAAGATLAALKLGETVEPATRRWLARVLWDQGRTDVARQQLDAAVEEDPGADSLVLRAHLSRALGEPAAAAADLERAAEMVALAAPERLLFAEVLINCGRLDRADQVVAELGTSAAARDSRLLLLRAELEGARGSWQSALRTLRGVPGDAPVAGRARARIAAIATAHPATRGALSALNSVPADERDDLYWIARGNVRLAMGSPERALGNWRRVDPDDHEWLRGSRTAVARWHLAELYNAGEDQRILALADEELVASRRDRRLAGIVACALARQVAADMDGDDRDVDDRGANASLERVERLQALIGDDGQPEEMPLLRGLLLARLARYDEALDAFSSLSPERLSQPAVAIEHAVAAAREGDAEQAALCLERLDTGSAEGTRAAIACSAIAGRWQEAADLLRGLPAERELLPFQAAALLQAGERSALEGLPSDSSAVGYYQAVDLLEQARLGAARRKLSTIGRAPETRAAADRLEGWMSLQRLQDAPAVEALDHLVEGVRLWPESVSESLPLDREPVARLFLLSGAREQAGDALEARARATGLGDPASCHNLALFHLAEGARLAGSGDAPGGLRHWELSVACMGVTLGSFGYVQRWAADRQDDYRAGVDSEAVVGLESRVLEHYEGVLGGWAERLRQDGAEGESRQVAELATQLRAEMRGTRKLSDLGGLALDDGDPPRTIACGALYVSKMGLETRFARLLAGLESDAQPQAEETGVMMLRKLLEAIGEEEEAEGSPAVDPEDVEELKRLFSPLRLARVLELEGHPAQALAAVREVRAGGGTTAAAGVNPAFAHAGGDEEFTRLAARYELNLLLRLGKREVASTEDRLEAGLDYWLEALALAEGTGDEEWVVERIRERTVGRADVLLRQDQHDRALKLLEGVERLCDGERVRGLLAPLYANRGIDAANNDRHQEAVDDLRRARKLNRHSTHINSQLAMALALRARELSNAERKIRLLREASELADEARRADPYDEKLQELANGLHMELANASLFSGDLLAGEGSVEDLFELLLGGAPQHDKRKSTEHHNKGVKLVEAGNLDAGIAELERALELEPTSRQTRKMLAQAYEMDSTRQLDRHDVPEAIARLERAVELDPGNGMLQFQLMMLRGLGRQR